MTRVWFLSLLLTLSLSARSTAIPTQECEAFNNMKHTRNTHHVVLDTTKKYTILKHHKGQDLILISGEQPAQRWVNDTCFYKSSGANVSPVASSVVRIDDEIDNALKRIGIAGNTKKYKNINSKKYYNNKISQNNILALSWHNAFCETHRYKKECKRRLLSILKSEYYEKHFVLHGLWPQPKNRTYCHVERKYITMDRYKRWNKMPELKLSRETKERLSRVMPGFASNLHKHEWYKHGSCYGTDAEQYYKNAIDFTDQISASKVNDFFVKHIGKRVTLKQIRDQFDSSFGTGSGKRVALQCRNGLITELWIHLGSGNIFSQMLKNGKQIHSRCQRGLVDRAGFTKETNQKGGFGR